MSGPPRLTVSTQSQSSPSTPFGPPVRRAPQGARKRNAAPGLFIANPDNSDGDGDSPKSSTGRSPVASSSSGSRAVPIYPMTSGGGSGSGASPTSVRSGASMNTGPTTPQILSMPTIPAPQSTPLPTVTAFPVPHPSPRPDQYAGQTPPQPPPQPERHLRRAFTTPYPADQPHPIREPRASLGNVLEQPSSPSRQRPPLPSPPPASSRPSPHTTHSLPLPAPAPPPNYPPPAAPTERPYLSPIQQRTDSPETALSPSGQSEGARSLGSLGSVDSANRARSGSTASNKKLLQVTMDNEQFTIVDITGMNTSEAILERVFSKLRFRDDDHPTLTLYRTDIGEAADPNPIPKDTLFQLCSKEADSKATLKFLVLQTGVPESSSASVVPPIAGHIDESTYRSEQATMGPPSNGRHSKEGSLSSTSEILERGGILGSDWSDLGPETEDWQRVNPGSGGSLKRTKHSVKSISGRFMSSSGSAGSSKSPLTDSSTLQTPTSSLGNNAIHESSNRSSPRSSNEYDRNRSPIAPIPESRQPTFTPTQPPKLTFPIASTSNAVAGSSRSQAGLGLTVDDGMDPETRALIEQFQREEEEARRAEVERRRQEEADEEFARREQQSERDVWQMMQEMTLEQRRLELEQIAEDERQARQVEAEERLAEERRQAEEHRRQEEENRERASRGASFSENRRALRQEWLNRGGANDTGQGESWTLPALNEAPAGYGQRRPSDGYSSTVLDSQLYTSPSAQFTPEVPGYGNRRPTGFATGRYEEETHAQDRLNDPRLQHINGRGQSIPRRGQPRHPYMYGREGNPQSPSLQNARSMDSLRHLDNAPVSRPPYQGIPARQVNTPPAETYYRRPSIDRSQDGRYPEPSNHIPIGSMAFPSPRPHTSGTWQNYSEEHLPPARRSYDGMPTPPRRGSGQDQTPGSPQTSGLPRRPHTLHDDSPPQSSRTIAGFNHPGYSDWRPRSGSMSQVPGGSASPLDQRRASESSAYGDRDPISPESTHLAVPRSNRHDTGDTVSSSGTVTSGNTVRGRPADDEESADTVKAGDLHHQWNAMVQRGRDENASYRFAPVDPEDEEEATLFFTPSASNTNTGLRSPTHKPHLKVNTGGAFPLDAPPYSETTPSDSATESESESRIHRHKSFAKPKGQWHFRPEPEQLYDNLDILFPKIDLDQPIVEQPHHHNAPSTPTTPAADESSPKYEYSVQPPPIHPSRSGDTRLPQSPRTEKHDSPGSGGDRLPPPQHPSRNHVHEEPLPKDKELVGKGVVDKLKFNKTENRKSIRYLAQDWKRRTLNRGKEPPPANSGKEKESPAAAAKEEARNKLERRKSSSMWGHKVVEVTPSKLQNGGVVPPTIPESPSGDISKTTTLTWVKGELIGKGSYGRVYIALNVTSGEMMAVKQVELPATERDRHDRRQLGMIQALQSEIALLKDLYHPNIVQYLGTETSPEFLSIFLEYVPGGTIASIYRTPNQAPFEEQLVKYFTAQILEGLAYLHAKHIWHRDLKGDNILVDAAGICKISDFGISKQTADAYDSFGQATNMKGSVFWMAPEVIHSANERTYSGKVDIWSLGCVVLEMWTGQRPWGEMEQVAAMFELFNKRARPPIPPHIKLSEVALDFMNQKCLATDPSSRPMARELLNHEFITNVDPRWTFAESRIGKAVGRRAKKSVNATPLSQGSSNQAQGHS